MQPDFFDETFLDRFSRVAGFPLQFVVLTIGLVTLLAEPSAGLDSTKGLNQYVHQVWTLQNGLPAGGVQAITQTRDGYLWVGTEEGLARFDGARFEVFDKISGQLPGNYVYSLLEDSNGALWIGTSGGLVCYRTGKFQTIGSAAGLGEAFVYGIAQDREGTLWLSANYKLWCYRAHSFTCFDPLQEPTKLGGVIDLTVDQSDTVWVVLKGGIVCRFRANHFEPVPEFAGLKGHALERISTDFQGAVWISDFSGAAYRYQNEQVEAFGSKEGLSSVPTSRIIRSREGSVWLGTDRGVARITDGKCTSFQSKGDDTLQIDSGSAVYEDQEGNLWVGCAGLHRFTDGSFTPFGPEEGLPDDSIRAVCEDSDQNLWVATSDGIYRGDQGDHRFRQVLAARDRLGGDLTWVQLLADPRDHSLWIGTMQGLFHYYYQTGALAQYTTSDNLPGNSVFSLCLDRQGRLWIGCETGLACWKEGKFVTPEVCQRAALKQAVGNLVEDHDGGIWIGTSSGPMLYKNEAITRFGLKDGLKSILCFQILVDSDGAVWISTWNGGLSLYTGNGFFTYSQEDGLPADQIMGIIDDPIHGDLWLGSNKGVFRVGQKQLEDFRAGRITHISGTAFGVSDGLKAGINGDGKPTVTRTHDGKLWWSTDQGAVVVDPNHLALQNKPGPTVIESVAVDDRTLSDRNLELVPGTRRLEIEYASLTYAAADKVQFRYRLDGVDRNWFNAGQRREAIFTNLRPGNYRFRVQSSADGGTTWPEPGAELGFYVQPHFYETWWFLALCLSAAAALGWAFLLLRRRRLEEHFREVIAERVRVAGEIHDSLAQGFASAAMFLDNLDRVVPPDSPLRVRLKSIRHILGTSLTDARAMIATLRGQPGENEDLESALRKLVERLAPISSTPIILDFGKGKIPPVPVTTQLELMRICQEGMNNAIRHANARHIWVTLEAEEGQTLRLMVRDDGKGFEFGRVTSSGEDQHFGLTGLAERAKRIGATLTIRSQPASGTEIELILPLQRKHTISWALGSS